MHNELDSIMQLGIYKLIKLPPNHKVIDTKWVYQIKCNLNGNIAHYKAQLVAKGFTQKPGINFNETFALVAKIEPIRLLCALTTSLDWEIHVIDINSSFLNSNMPSNQHTYVKQLLGFKIEGSEDLVWKLYKALYVLQSCSYYAINQV